MSDTDMLTAIINAIQTDANLITLIRYSVTNGLQIQPTAKLQAIMSVLGLPTS